MTRPPVLISPSPLGSRSAATVVVPGDLLSTNVDEFRHLVMPPCESLPAGSVLTIDLRAARLVDSVGLNALVTVIKSTKARHGEVHLLIAHPTVRRILTFTRIDTHAVVVGSDLS